MQFLNRYSVTLLKKNTLKIKQKEKYIKMLRKCHHITYEINVVAAFVFNITKV